MIIASLMINDVMGFAKKGPEPKKKVEPKRSLFCLKNVLKPICRASKKVPQTNKTKLAEGKPREYTGFAANLCSDAARDRVD